MGAAVRVGLLEVEILFSHTHTERKVCVLGAVERIYLRSVFSL